VDEAQQQLLLSRKHLAKVQRAVATEPVDWADLYIFGLYAVEMAAKAAGTRAGISEAETHAGQVNLANRLHEEHGLPDVEDMLRHLQRNRLHEAYGKLVPSGEFDAREVAAAVEGYVDAVGRIVDG
jgi:hypothetical protein